MIPISHFQGAGGAIVVSFIAFSIVFIVLAGLCAMIYATRYFAMIAEKKKAEEKAVPPAVVPVSAVVSQTVEGSAKDMKKVVAIISAVINASAGRSMNIISVTPAQNYRSNMNQMWRVTGIAECMASRFGSGSRS